MISNDILSCPKEIENSFEISDCETIKSSESSSEDIGLEEFSNDNLSELKKRICSSSRVNFSKLNMKEKVVRFSNMSKKIKKLKGKIRVLK